MLNILNNEKRNARHGQFFFAKFQIGNYIRKSPIFILNNEYDNNDDVIICLCTTKGPKSEFDVEVQLKEKSYIRTNKIHVISRNQLLFKIDHEFKDNEYENMSVKLKKALDIKSY